MNPIQKQEIREDNSDSLEINDGIGFVVEALVDMDDLGVDETGKNGEEAFEIGEERRVIEGPGAGLVQVPLRERERVSES